MKIKGWEKISGLTYKGYCIVNPIHNAGEEVYYATILNLNEVYKPKWDIELTATPVKGIITFRIKDNLTTLLLAKSHLTKTNIDILEGRQNYTASKVTKNINGGTTGIINQVQNAGTNVTYGLPKSGSLSHQSIQSQLIQQLKELQEQIDKINSK
jgi:hypothetical protein